MPELPEVEIVKRQLNKYLVGHVIEKVEVRYAKCFQGNKLLVVGGRVERIRRFGKAQSIDLDNGYSIVVHIKLTGQLIYRGPNLEKTQKLSKKVLDGIPGKHTHVIFHLNRGAKLYYNDVRKFGWIRIVISNRLQEISFLNKLGPEPVIDPKNPPANPLTLEKFSTVVQSTGRSIKTLLMDQSKIAGVGNIYANDALWLAKIHPKKSSKKLSNQDTKRLFKAIEKVLKEGLKRGGASELSFVTPDGGEGNYQDHFLAYGREGDTCPRCKKTKFKKIKLSGRGTVYCATCQIK